MEGRTVSLALLFISAVLSATASAKTCQEMGGEFQPSYFRCPGGKINVTGTASGIVCCVRENRPKMHTEYVIHTDSVVQTFARLPRSAKGQTQFAYGGVIPKDVYKNAREDTKSCASMHGHCESLWLDPCYSGRIYFKTKDCVGRVCCVP